MTNEFKTLRILSFSSLENKYVRPSLSDRRPSQPADTSRSEYPKDTDGYQLIHPRLPGSLDSETGCCVVEQRDLEGGIRDGQCAGKRYIAVMNEPLCRR